MSSELPPSGGRDGPPPLPPPVRKRRYQSDRYPSGTGGANGILGALVCAGITFVIGLLATPFYDSLFLWLLILPAIVAPVTGFLLWIVFESRSPWIGRGAAIFGTLSFLIAGTCYLALVKAF